MGNDASAARTPSKKIRILLLTQGSPFLAPIVRGILEGGTQLVAVLHSTRHPLSRRQLWRRRLRCLLVDRWPPQLARRLVFVDDRDSSAITDLITERKVDLMIVSRWRILKEDVFDKLPLGALNTHISLLPELRGANPIPGALLAGLRRTGVTIHFIDRGIDSGDIILQRSLSLTPNETEASIIAKAADLVGPMYAEVIRYCRSGRLPRRPQASGQAFYFSWTRHFGSSPEEPLAVDWHAPAWLIERVSRLRRCCTSWKGASAEIASCRAVRMPRGTPNGPGVLISTPDRNLVAGTGEGFVKVHLQGPRQGPSQSGGAPLSLTGQKLDSGTWPKWQELTAWVRGLPLSERFPYEPTELDRYDCC